MKRIFILPSFERSVRRLGMPERRKVRQSLEVFNALLSSGQNPSGFGFKKINHDKYEFRVDARLRVIVKVEDDDYYLVLAGSHDWVKRYLRRYR